MQNILTWLAVGFVLLCTEVFLPGGVLGVLGGCALLYAVVLGYQQFPPVYAHLLLVGVVLGVGLGMVWWAQYLPRSFIGRRLTLTRSQADSSTVDSKMSSLLGEHGVAHTDLRPVGIALFRGQRYDVISDGGVIARGTAIRVVGVEGNQVLVRPLPGAAARGAPDSRADASGGGTEDPIS